MTFTYENIDKKLNDHSIIFHPNTERHMSGAEDLRISGIPRTSLMRQSLAHILIKNFFRSSATVWNRFVVNSDWY